MNEEFSFESIFNAGVGNKPVAKVEPMSVERFDGSFDNIFAEVARSEEELDFIEKFGAVSEMNSVNKMKMLAKLKKTYGSCNRGLESFIQSCEADEVDGTSAKKDEAKSDDKATEQPKGTDQKKENWAKTALKAVVSFFKKIWGAIVSLVKSIVSAISNKFNENKLNKMAKKDGGDTFVIEFAKKAQDSIKKMEPTVKRLSKEADDIWKQGIKQFNAEQKKNYNKNEKMDAATSVHKSYVAIAYSQISTSIKLMTTLEQIVYKVFAKFRSDVVKGNIKTVKSGSIESFVRDFNRVGVTISSSINQLKNGGSVDFEAVCKEASKLVTETAGIQIADNPYHSIHQKTKDFVKATNAFISSVKEALSKEEVMKKLGQDLFGIEEDKSVKKEEKK